MAIKVKIPADVASVKIDPLYQWDYGQTLEIESPILPSGILEVHFSCSGMTEAFVRPCAGTGGIYSVRVPDACLEQSTDITAWIYEKSTDSGKTLKTITIPINERPRPNRVGEIPQSANDVYTESITEINKLIEKMESGEIVVKAAQTAETAQSATNAVSAQSAVSAHSAQNAASAQNATGAQILTGAWVSNLKLTRITQTGLYCFFGKVPGSNIVVSFGTMYYKWGTTEHYATVWRSGYHYELKISSTGVCNVSVYNSSGTQDTTPIVDLYGFPISTN